MEEKKAWNVKALPVYVRRHISGEATRRGITVAEFVTILWKDYENAQRVDKRLA